MEPVLKRGTIWHVDLPPPEGSEPGDIHPVLILQRNDFTRTGIRTVIGALITSNMMRGRDPGNVEISPEDSGLAENSVVNVSQIVTFDKSFALERIGKLQDAKMVEVEQGLRLWLGLAQ